MPTSAIGTRNQDGDLVLAWTAAEWGTAAGRHLLKYVAICTLDSDDKLIAGADQFSGYYGLAPEWSTGSCDGTCQRWVSACVLAHANANGTPFHISLRGNHEGLAVSASTAAEYSYQEAAFYGNIFQRQTIACVGDGKPLTSLVDADRILKGRVCGQAYGNCGLTSAGYCASIAANIAACAKTAPQDGGYEDCHTGSLLTDALRVSPTIHEVITVYNRQPQ